MTDKSMQQQSRQQPDAPNAAGAGPLLAELEALWKDVAPLCGSVKHTAQAEWALNRMALLRLAGIAGVVLALSLILLLLVNALVLTLLALGLQLGWSAALALLIGLNGVGLWWLLRRARVARQHLGFKRSRADASRALTALIGDAA